MTLIERIEAAESGSRWTWDDAEELCHDLARAHLLKQRDDLRAAATALYMAGRWSCDREVDEAKLWTDLRDALGLQPGTATAAGVHAGAAS